MVGASAFERSLLASLEQAPEQRLICVKKTLAAVENEDVKSTHRLCQVLRRVLNSVADDPDVTPEVTQSCADFHRRVRAIDPRRRETHEQKAAAELLADCSGGDGTSFDGDRDEWDQAPPLHIREQQRIIELQRPYQESVQGQWVLRPGANARQMLQEALDGRTASVETLLKLYNHLEDSFYCGGFALSGGALYAEVSKILRAQGVELHDHVVPNIIDEVRARN